MATALRVLILLAFLYPLAVLAETKLNCTQQTAVIAEYVTLAKSLGKQKVKPDCSAAQKQWTAAKAACSGSKCQASTPYEKSDCQMCSDYKSQCLKLMSTTPVCTNTAEAQPAKDEFETDPVKSDPDREPSSRPFGSI